MRKVTENEKMVFEFIKDRIEEGYPPTVREICAEFGFKSTSTAHRYINNLTAKVLLEKGNNQNTDGDAAHQGEADGQQHRHRDEDGELRAQRHGTLGHVALKHLLVHLRAFEPAVQSRGAASEAERRHQDERRGGQDRQHHADHPQREA